MMAERNISNKELAALTGMHPTSISKIKTRRRLTRIDEETLNTLCEALCCQPGDLMVYEKEEQEQQRKHKGNESGKD
ncbi:helix-turn-helix domain-containing protein [Microseira sp. BLCC-F43]|uniref:helix-turn-helix domain-containing protein n=1 Tax=Microseira sp. BLCC-F43 TaxID=3153602 RepID=UPI0035B72461